MNGTLFLKRITIGVLVLLLAVPAEAFAQPPGTNPPFSREELDQMLAPIALYPDSLVAQILMAATFPAEVDEANQWLAQNKDLRGDQMNAALDRVDWDLSVKALVPFPGVLAMMSDRREWTQRLGQAFMGQETDVMDSVQRLRSQAYAAGNLKSNEQQRVVVQDNTIGIEPANPRVVYVPSYNPAAAYGAWGYPSYPPYAYSPYYPAYTYDPNYVVPGLIVAGVVAFAAGIAVASAWNHGWGHWDWRHRHVNVNVNRRVNINREDLRLRQVRTTNWQRVQRERAAARAADRQTQKRVRGRTALESTEARGTSASVDRGARQRAAQEQARQRRAAKQERAQAIRAGRAQTGAAGGGATVRERKGGAKQKGGAAKAVGRQND